MKFRWTYLVSAAVISTALFLLSGCLATPIDETPADVAGTWHGESTVRTPVSFDAHRDVEYTRVPVEINITIHEDASVSGTVGGAEVQQAILKKNRGELGRRLHVANDYLIADGYLDGPLVPGDTELYKEFTIPFDIEDDQLAGSVMWTESWKYPSPLAEVKLSK